MPVLCLHSLCRSVSRSYAFLVTLPTETDFDNCGGTGQELKGRKRQEKGQDTTHRNYIFFTHLKKCNLMETFLNMSRKMHYIYKCTQVHKVVKAAKYFSYVTKV